MKSVFTLKTFSADGLLLGSANGFFVGTEGEAMSVFAPFKGADRAIVIDAAGREYPVVCMLGASDTYDVAHFRVDAHKTQPLTVASSGMSVGSQAWLLPYRAGSSFPQGAVRKVETFNGEYDYYTLALSMPENSVGTPLMNERGEVAGVIQQPNAQGDTLSYAVSARYVDSLRVTGLSLNDPVLRSTGIRTALPDDEGQAVLTLYMAGVQMDSARYAALVDEFVRQFPKSQEGYLYKAQLAADGNLFDEADAQVTQALKVATKADEVHYAYARMIYQKELYRPQMPYAPWSLDKALDESVKAYEHNALPTYRHLQGDVLFAQSLYNQAYEVYASLFDSQLRSADLFYEAARCKELMGDTLSQMALLDSCLAQFSRPYLKEAAPYLLACAQARMNVGRNRDATGLLNDYEQLMSTQVNDQFYYLRFQAEVGGRLFQQALNDISRAIAMNPQSDLYYAEKASLEVRVGLYDDAMQTAREGIGVAPDHSDGYLFLGLAQCLKGDKAEGVKNLLKAKELGDPQADELIEKYSK